MAAMARQERFPREIRVGTEGGGRVYRLDEQHYAEHGRRRSAPAADAVMLLEGGRIAVVRGDVARATPGVESGAARIGPVYLSADGVRVVPTDLVFVRFAEGTAAEARRADLERAGFEIVDVPGYAPHAAWVRARDGGIAASLEGLGDLRALPGVQHVEPQLLMERVAR
jgi:hypothetical protein